MNRVAAVLFGMVVGASCSDPQVLTIPQLNLDRPVDIAFACDGPLRVTSEADRPVIDSAQPAVSCETRSPQAKADVGAPPLGQEELDNPSWYGFIAQSAPGTVAVARWPIGPAEGFTDPGFNRAEFTVLDVDPLTPGKNAISVGEEPIAIATDRAGCFAVTANAGSCDASTLEIHGAVDDDTSTPIVVKRVQIKNALGEPLRARPAAMIAEPNTDVVGNRCPATASGVVYVAYPNCHLVAAVDLATEKVVAGIRFDATGVVVTGGDVRCHDECPNDTNVLGGPAATSGTRPVTLDLEVDSFGAPPTVRRRLAIGADNLAAVTVVDLDESFLPVAPGLQVPLEDRTGGKLGVAAISLSLRIAMGNADKGSPGGPGQYVYAMTTDDTVRVVDVLDLNRECDTQVDTRFVRTSSARALQCFPVGDPATPARRVGARSPGIQLPGNAIPTSVAVVNGRRNKPAVTPDLDASLLYGTFAMIGSSTGESFVVNVDDEIAEDVFEPTGNPLKTAPSSIMAHQLRDAIAFRDAPFRGPPPTPPDCGAANPTVGGVAAGGPRGAPPLSNAAIGVPGVISGVKSDNLPFLRQVACDGDDTKAVSEVQFAAPVEERDSVYPDLGAVRGETWALTWEGALSADNLNRAVDGPVIRSAQMRVDGTGMHLAEQTRPYCEMGVEPFDIVQFRGCNPSNGNSDCPAGYDCLVHPQSQIAFGSCILASEAQRLVNACRDFLITLRHYSVGRADSGELLLLPRKRVLRTTPLDGCSIGTDAENDTLCENLADYAAKLASASHPKDDTTPPDPHEWQCRTDETRAPINTDPLKNKRCVLSCGLHGKDIDGKDRDADCEVGTICVGATGIEGPTRGVCMEGVTPPQACVNGPQRYEVHAGEAFAVIGNVTGFLHPLIADAAQGGRCIRDPAASPLQIGRLPLKAPPCTASPADPITDLLPNPCSLATEQRDSLKTDYRTSTLCDEPSKVVRSRTAPAIKFRHRNMTLTMVDPTAPPADLTCLHDLLGTAPADRIPIVFTGYQFAFTQNAPFTPMTSTISPTYPVKVVRGPGDSIWVIDDGDFLSFSPNLASTRGGVYRVDPIAFSLPGILLQ